MMNLDQPALILKTGVPHRNSTIHGFGVSIEHMLEIWRMQRERSRLHIQTSNWPFQICIDPAEWISTKQYWSSGHAIPVELVVSMASTHLLNSFSRSRGRRESGYASTYGPPTGLSKSDRLTWIERHVCLNRMSEQAIPAKIVVSMASAHPLHTFLRS